MIYQTFTVCLQVCYGAIAIFALYSIPLSLDVIID